jgi:hypothetical protein
VDFGGMDDSEKRFSEIILAKKSFSETDFGKTYYNPLFSMQSQILLYSVKGDTPT